MDTNKDARQPNEEPTSPAPPSGPVMDVKPPDTSSTASAGAPANPDPVVATPPATDDAPASTDDPSPITDANSSTAEPQPSPAAAAAHHMPMGPILVAVFIALLLAVVAVLAFMKSGDQLKDDNNTSNSTQQSTKPTASGEDIDRATQDIDKDLNSVNDSTDFGSDELSDTNLQLN